MKSPAKSNVKPRRRVTFTPSGDEEEDGSGENMADVLTILQEYQKSKSYKGTSRAAAMEAKKRVINEACYAEMREMQREGTAYIEQVHASVDGLMAQEAATDAAFRDISALFGARSHGADAQLALLGQLLSELSPARAAVIEANSTDLHSHKAKMEKSWKRVLKKARRELHSGMEQQKVATDAEAYMKHYKHLVGQ